MGRGHLRLDQDATGVKIQNAYRQLGVEQKDVFEEPHVRESLHHIFKIVKGVVPQAPADAFYFLSISNDPDARKILAEYYRLLPAARACLPIEAFCLAAQVPTSRVLEIITGTAVRISSQASALVAAISQPDVVASVVDTALNAPEPADKTAAAALLLRGTGFLPQPKGSQTIVNVHANAAVDARSAVVAAPSPESTIRRIAGRFQANRPAVLDAATVPAESVALDVIDASATDDDAEADEDV